MRPLTTESGSSTDSALIATPPSFGTYLDISFPQTSSPSKLSPPTPYTPLTTPAFTFAPGALPSAVQEDPISSIFSYFPNVDGFSGDPFGSTYDNVMSSAVEEQFAPYGLFSHSPGNKTECRCHGDTNIYALFGDLSTRLRRTVDLLDQHPLHSSGQVCTLKGRIADLDALIA
jgi:hypothetical protein